MAYVDIDSNKVLNKEGLLELSAQIKGYINANTPSPYTLPTASTITLGGVKIDGSTITIDNNGVISAAGGGSSYTAGNGIDIDANGVISTIPSPFFSLSFMSNLSSSYSPMLNDTTTMNWDEFVGSLKKGKILTTNNSQASYLNKSAYRLTPQVVLGDANARLWLCDMTTEPTNNLVDTQGVRVYTNRAYYFDGKILYTWATGADITAWMNVRVNNQSKKLETVINEINTRIPAAPTTDGTYMLKCVVSSGTPTYSWESVSVGGSY